MNENMSPQGNMFVYGEKRMFKWSFSLFLLLLVFCLITMSSSNFDYLTQKDLNIETKPKETSKLLVKYLTELGYSNDSILGIVGNVSIK